MRRRGRIPVTVDRDHGVVARAIPEDGLHLGHPLADGTGRRLMRDHVVDITDRDPCRLEYFTQQEWRIRDGDTEPTKYKAYYTSVDSRTPVTFPYTKPNTEYVHRPEDDVFYPN